MVPTADAVVPADLDGVTALVIDVLRASTTIITAFAHGCREIVPVGDPADARRRAGAVPADGVLTAGERGGEPIPGFDLGNSPGAYTPRRCKATTLVLTTSNGTAPPILRYTPVTDLGPLRGIALRHLDIEELGVTDLAPLRGMPLTHLWLTFRPERDAEVGRALTTLQIINDKPAAEFWKEVDGK